MGVSNLPINLTIYSPHGNKTNKFFKPMFYVILYILIIEKTLPDVFVLGETFRRFYGSLRQTTSFDFPVNTSKVQSTNLPYT
jgi:hypothetical protein